MTPFCRDDGKVRLFMHYIKCTLDRIPGEREKTERLEDEEN